MLNYEPTLPLHPPPRAIPTVDVRAHYTLPDGLVIVVVVHQHHHRPPPPPSSPSRGWLLLGAACRHRHPHHCRPPPTQPHQRRRPRRLASSSSHPCDPPPPPSPSRPLRPLDRPGPRHGPACGINALPPGPTWQVPLSHAPPLRKRHRHERRNASVSVDPPSLLGPPPPVGRRRRQHGDVDGRPWQPGAATRDCWSAVWVGCGCVVGCYRRV